MQGKIWKAKENYSTPEWDLGACFTSGSTYNDLTSGRYVLDNVVMGTGKDIKFYLPGTTDTKFKDSYYTGENLGAISDR